MGDPAPEDGAAPLRFAKLPRRERKPPASFVCVQPFICLPLPPWPAAPPPTPVRRRSHRVTRCRVTGGAKPPPSPPVLSPALPHP